MLEQTNMKLYATTTSERASKGQGGNENLLTVFTVEIDGQRQEIAHMDIINRPEYYVFDWKLPDGTKGALKVSKGKKQKGDRLGLCHCGYPCIYGTDYCERHQTP